MVMVMMIVIMLREDEMPYNLFYYFRGIFATLDLMKLDMVNFTIQQIRPYLQSHSIEYEKSKFKELLKQQEGKHFVVNVMIA